VEHCNCNIWVLAQQFPFGTPGCANSLVGAVCAQHKSCALRPQQTQPVLFPWRLLWLFRPCQEFIYFALRWDLVKFWVYFQCLGFSSSMRWSSWKCWMLYRGASLMQFPHAHDMGKSGKKYFIPYLWFMHRETSESNVLILIWGIHTALILSLTLV
jgi:hypothetical protein